MPAIQIRESEPYFFTSTGDQRLAWKYIIGQLLSLDSMLSIERVVSDNSSSYEVLLKVGGSNAGFLIRCYNSGLSISRCLFRASGSYTNYDNKSISNFFVLRDSGTRVKVSTAGIDGVLKYSVFTSDASDGGCLWLATGMFTSDSVPDPVYVCESYSGTYGYNSNWPTPAAAPVVLNLPHYRYDDASDSLQWVSFDNGTTAFDSAWKRSGYQYVFRQIAPRGYTDTQGYLNIKWGGAYDVYYLENNAGDYVATNFGETVTINGASALSGGVVALIE